MHLLKKSKLLLPALILLMIGSSSPANEIRNNIAQATRGLKDITLTGKVLYGNQRELAKIGKDFPKSYEFKTTTVRYKAPDKMRMEGKLGMVTVAVIVNGDTKAISIPSVKYSKKENIKSAPHKRQTAVDIGLITDDLWHSFIVTDTVSEKGSTGTVYRITFVRSNARDRKLVCWVEPDTAKLLKFDKYHDDGSLKSRFIYSKHTRVNGIWVPGRVDVYNEDGKLAGTTAYENVKVNTGIPDSVFKS